MTDEKILTAINKTDGLGGMTVNEQLYVTGLLNELDKSLKFRQRKG